MGEFVGTAGNCQPGCCLIHVAASLSLGKPEVSLSLILLLGPVPRLSERQQLAGQDPRRPSIRPLAKTTPVVLSTASSKPSPGPECVLSPQSHISKELIAWSDEPSYCFTIARATDHGQHSSASLGGEIVVGLF